MAAITTEIINAAVLDEKDDYNSFNGSIGVINLSSTIQRIDESRKIVATVLNQMNPTATIARILWVADGMPEESKISADAISQKTLEASLELIGFSLCLYEFLALAHAAGVRLEFRTSDVVDAATWAPIGNARDGKYMVFARKLINIARQDENRMAVLAKDAWAMPYLAILNACHRKENNGHNFITSNLSVKKSGVHRLLRIAGPHKDEFAAYVAKNGHDGLHLLTTTALEALVDCMTGIRPHALAAGSTYMGKNVAGRDLHAVLSLNESAIDRWPPGAIGRSGMILGLGCVIFMIGDITSKIDEKFDEEVLAFPNAVKDDLSNNRKEFSRGLLGRYKDILAPLVCLAYGYCGSIRDLLDDTYEKPALAKFGKSVDSNYKAGLRFGSAMAKKEVTSQGLENMVMNMVTVTRMAMQKYAALVEVGDH